MQTKLNPFQTQLRINIEYYIRHAKRDGTVSMSLENLMQCVPTPGHMPGAPIGPNAPFFYRQMFKTICDDNNNFGFVQSFPFNRNPQLA